MTEVAAQEEAAAFVVELLQKGYTIAEAAAISLAPRQQVEQWAQEYQELIEDGQLLQSIASKKLDQDYADLEQTVLDQLKKTLAFETNSLVLLKAVSTLNSAKRRSVGEARPATNIHNDVKVVQLQLPTRMLESSEVHINAQGEVVGVGDKSYTTANQSNIKSLLEARAQQQLAQTLENARSLELSPSDFDRL